MTFSNSVPTFVAVSNVAPGVSNTVPSCTIPPRGWFCTRSSGHDGPCAAIPSTDQPRGDANSLCIVCGKKAYLWIGDESSSVLMKNPRGKARIMFPTRTLAFCGSECSRKHREPAGEALIRGDWNA